MNIPLLALAAFLLAPERERMALSTFTLP